MRFVDTNVLLYAISTDPDEAAKAFTERFDEFERTKYHQPTDDVYGNWYWKGARKVADMMALIGHRIAQADALPTFVAGNEYSGLVRGEAPKAADKQ